MRAEIVAIGTELTSGARLDTNSQWLSSALGDLGIPTMFHTTVADSFEDNVEALRIAVERADIVMLTGGLGPTQDDLTRDVLARLVNQPLELHEPSLEAIRHLFESRGRNMPDRNTQQAMFPATATPLPNPLGTAPGIWMEIARTARPGKCLLAAMPGVPVEMKAMFHDEVVPKLPPSGKLIRHKRVNCYGAGESHVESLLGDITARDRDPEVGITAHDATITLRIAAHGVHEEECQSKIRETETLIYQRLTDLIFGEEDDELEDVVVRQLAEKRATLSFMECGLAGLLSPRLSRVSGVFPGVVLAGEAEPATELTPERMTDMLSARREKRATDFMLATWFPLADTSGQASEGKYSLAALSTPADTFVERISMLGVHHVNLARTAKTALNMLRLHLQK